MAQPPLAVASAAAMQHNEGRGSMEQSTDVEDKIDVHA